MNLKIKNTVEIAVTSPFHFNSTFYKPAHFPSSDTKWESGKRWQTMLWPSSDKASGEQSPLGLVFKDSGTAEKPKVRVEIFSKEELSLQYIESLKTEIIWRYNLDLDLSGFYRAVDNDPLLAPVIKKFRGLRPMHHGSLYEYLIIAIVLQNATVRRSVYMMQTLFENYGTLLEYDGQRLWSFWAPEVLVEADEKRLRELKMGYRAKSLIKVSEPFSRGELNEFKLRTAPVEEQERALISLYGIGPASVGYIMLDVFHRWDYLKHVSPWEQKIYNKIFFDKDWEKELVPVDKMLKYFDRWGKWKNLAIHYVWEDIWWKRCHENLPWLEKLIRL